MIEKINLSKEIKVWDSAKIPVGTVVKLHGYSSDFEKDFGGKYYFVVGFHYDRMTVMDSAGDKCNIYFEETLESDDEEENEFIVKINIIAKPGEENE